MFLVRDSDCYPLQLTNRARFAFCSRRRWFLAARRSTVAKIGQGESTDTLMTQSPEVAYATVATPAHRKQFGQYFTPPRVASLMASWSLGNDPRSILDPAIGTGALVRACIDAGTSAAIVAYEKDAQIIKYCDVPSRVEVRHQDFLLCESPERFDAVVMNPPYVRHREFEGYESVRTALSLRTGYIIPPSANMYIYFSVKATLKLNAAGRAALLIPTEWMNSNFGVSFKKYLLERGLLREIVLFSGCSNVFEDALTTASVLLIEMPR